MQCWKVLGLTNTGMIVVHEMYMPYNCTYSSGSPVPLEHGESLYCVVVNMLNYNIVVNEFKSSHDIMFTF